MSDRGVIIDFDFAAAEGAELLFATAKKLLKDLDGIRLDAPMEARYLAGRSYVDGLAALFASVKTKKTALKAARELETAFAKALEKAVVAAVTPAFRNFVKALAARDVRIVIVTRADPDAVRPAFESLLCDSVVLHREPSAAYGAPKWDFWRRACVANGVRHPSSVAVTGSGFGVKAALLAGMGSVAVLGGHVAYQDFGGADDVVDELSGTSAKRVLAALRM